jgi:hypothetical protein
VRARRSETARIADRHVDGNASRAVLRAARLHCRTALFRPVVPVAGTGLSSIVEGLLAAPVVTSYMVIH